MVSSKRGVQGNAPASKSVTLISADPLMMNMTMVFSCPQQLKRTHCLSVPWAPLTIRVFTTLQSDPRDL